MPKPDRPSAVKKPALAAKWPALKIERRALSTLRPFERNARKHSPEQISDVARSIVEWGWTMPVLIDEDDTIIAGHARVLAAQQLDVSEAPVVVARGWTAQQKRAYALADNKLGLNSSWDDQLLRLEINDLRDAGQDLALMGFNDGDLAQLFLDRADGPTDPGSEWSGMPGFEQADLQGLKCLVHFATVEDRAAFEQLVGQTIPPVRKSIWYPKQPPLVAVDQQWRSDDDAAAPPAVHPEQGPQPVHADVARADKDGRGP